MTAGNSRSEQRDPTLTVITWNVNGVKNKLENSAVQNILFEADIVCLNEIKTGLSCALPGYVTYTSGGDRKHRGGCAVLIKNRLNDELLQMNRSEQDLIRFWFKQYSKIQFTATYIPPSDSPYFSLDCIARLNTAVCENPDDNVVILGDLNCRYASLYGSISLLNLTGVTCSTLNRLILPPHRM